MTRHVVIDTNVVVSSILSDKGAPSKIMNLCFSGVLRMVYTADIFDEYKRVLAYGKLNIAVETQAGITGAIREAGTMIDPPRSGIPMPDESDRVFYDTAKAGSAILITGNIKHYPAEPFIMTPADFLRFAVND